MIHNPTNHYEPQAMTDRKNSPEFHTLVFRNPETIAREELMEEFMFFAKEEFEMSKEEKSSLKTLVDAFIGYDGKKSAQGEKEMLKRWIQSVKG